MKGACLYLLLNELPKTQWFKTTTVYSLQFCWLTIWAVLSGLTHMSATGCQSVICSKPWSPSRWGLYT